MTKEVICIMCPLGCSMKAEVEGQEVTAVQGNRCKKGIKHAEREIFFPGRILTTTVRTNLQAVPLLPVRSNKEIPKSQLMACMAEISKHRVDGPLKIGEPLIKDILNSGADIVACRTIHFRSS